MDYPRRAEAWLDSKGRPAWIAAMVLGFIFVWPVGLAILFYMLWSGRMGCNKGGWGRAHRKAAPVEATGNAAFDEYREATLRRLEEERSAFVSFLDKLRRAKDKAEFDQFMADRGRGDGDSPAPGGPVSA
ncbi:DUF2852 domain-containing protein [Pikeienuella sp. HZG-20]|uniref:DUF2852 domain-containing protein n=1 Tax=Paludibacillus litoralis TaxID=3133267 RepID=UPI0030EF5CF0